eukprot:jgi/Mesvir1/23433/Mv22291-RA.2
MAAAVPMAPKKKFVLNKEDELRIEVYTWYSATLEVDGSPDSIYVANETPMISYVNTHALLAERRKAVLAYATANAGAGGSNGAAASNGVDRDAGGARVMVVGPTDSGKSTLAHILVNYAVRDGWQPMLVDLDIGQGSLSIPGTIGASPVERPLDFGAGQVLDAPLVFFYGHVDGSANPPLLKALIGRMAQLLDLRAQNDPRAHAAGIICNTMGWVDGLGYDLILDAIAALNINVVLVIGQERLWSRLADEYAKTPSVQIVKLNKSGGVVERARNWRILSRNQRVKEYFYGPKGDLCPHSLVLNFSSVSIYRIGGGPKAPSSALPIGVAPSTDPLRAVKQAVSKDLEHTVLAVSHAKDPKDLTTASVAGFLYVTDVSIQRQQLTVLAPCPGNPPSMLLIAGNVTWFEN